jgi:hypothetical protein
LSLKEHAVSQALAIDARKILRKRKGEAYGMRRRDFVKTSLGLTAGSLAAPRMCPIIGGKATISRRLPSPTGSIKDRSASGGKQTAGPGARAKAAGWVESWGGSNSDEM